MTTENLNMEAMHQMANIYARLGQTVRLWDFDWRAA